MSVYRIETIKFADQSSLEIKGEIVAVLNWFEAGSGGGFPYYVTVLVKVA